MQFELFAKDYIKLYFLNEIESKEVDVTIYFEVDGKSKNLLEYRVDGRPIYKINNFNVTEDKQSNVIVFRPRVVGCSGNIVITTGSDKKIEIVKNGTNIIEQTIIAKTGQTKLDLKAEGTAKYLVNINDGTGGSTSNSNPAPQQTSTPRPTPAPQPTPTPQPNNSSFRGGSDFGSSGSFGAGSSAGASAGSNTGSSGISDFGSSGSFGASYGSDFGSGASANPGINPGTNPGASGFGNSGSFGTPGGFAGNPFDPTAESIREQEKKADDLDLSNERLNSDIIILRNRLADLEAKNQQLVLEKQTLIARLDKLQAEYDKDYESREADIEEIKSRYDIDRDLIEQYSNRDIVSIEQLFSQAEYAIQTIEEQIKLLVEAKAKKTEEIEKELQIGKKEQ